MPRLSLDPIWTLIDLKTAQTWTESGTQVMVIYNQSIRVEHVPFNHPYNMAVHSDSEQCMYIHMLRFYLALCTPLFVTSPCPVPALCSTALLSDCLFRPCWVGCPVLKGILFCSCSRVSVSTLDFKGFVWVGDMGVCVARAKIDSGL